MAHSPEVQELLEKQEIYELVAKYCRGIDRRDLDLVRSCYHPDAKEHHPGFDGDIDGFIAMLSRGGRTIEGTMHVIANHLVEFEGDRARSETYVNAYHWGAPYDDPGANFSTGSRYVDHLHKRERVWKVAERWCVRNWIRVEVGSGEIQLPNAENGWPAARPGRDDIIYQPLR